MTDRLDDAFGSLDQLDPPDQWAEIERRAEMRVVLPALAPGHGRYRWIVAAAVIVVVAMIALVAVAADDSPSRVTTTEPATPTTTGAPGSGAKVRTYLSRSSIACDTGVVVPDLPGDAGLVITTASEDGAMKSVAWHEGTHQVTVSIAPVPLYGAVPAAPGDVIPTGPGSALARIRLPAPCDLVDIAVRPGDAGAGAAAVAAAARLTTIPTAGGHQCGPPPARAITGTLPVSTPADAVIAYFAWAIGSKVPSDFGEITQDPTSGPCRVFVNHHPSDLHVDTFVTGSPGAYRVTSVSGAIGGAVQQSVGVTVAGRSIQVDFDDPCEGCTEGTLDLTYDLDPEDLGPIVRNVAVPRIHLDAHRHGSGWRFEGTLQAGPPNSATGTYLLVMRDRKGTARAIVARTIPGGDYSTR
jgi:hypothetical protein